MALPAGAQPVGGANHAFQIEQDETIAPSSRFSPEYGKNLSRLYRAAKWAKKYIKTTIFTMNLSMMFEPSFSAIVEMYFVLVV
jgi:hypothetical protein